MKIETMCPSELELTLRRFEPGSDLAEFRDTAVYNSLQYNHQLQLRRQAENSRERRQEAVLV